MVIIIGHFSGPGRALWVRCVCVCVCVSVLRNNTNPNLTNPIDYMDGTRREWPRPRRWPHPPRRDVCRSRDVTETLKCTLSCSSKQVNVGLTTVATVTACLLVSWCILDFCVFNGSDYVQTVLYGTTGCWYW